MEPVYGGAVDEGGAGRDAHATFISKIRERANAFPSHAGWNLCQYYSHPDPKKINDELQNDIDGGVDAISILFNCNAEGSADDGVAIRS